MYIGIDLGGTNIAAALVNESCEIVKRVSIPAVVSCGAESVIAGLLKVSSEVWDPCVTRVGIGVPGQVSSSEGIAVFTPNLPLRDTNITSAISQKYSVPVLLGNDANCAALGEVLAGAARGHACAVVITLGTGVGGGIVINNKIHTGLNGTAGELGHMQIFGNGRLCGCSRRGCWETYASASGLVTTARNVLQRHKNSRLLTDTDGGLKRLDGLTIFNAYRDGDSAAVMIVRKYIEHLAAGVISIINVIEPEIICFGGGISNAWDCIEPELTEIVKDGIYARGSKCIEHTALVRAQLGGDAGIIGAAMLEN